MAVPCGGEKFFAPALRLDIGQTFLESPEFRDLRTPGWCSQIAF
jgi:hypothetical protein